MTSKISYTFDKTLVISVICSKYSVNNHKIFKGEENFAILEILGLIESNVLYISKKHVRQKDK